MTLKFYLGVPYSHTMWKQWQNCFDLKDVYVYDPPGDGNCQFEAVSYGGTPVIHASADALRQMASEAAREMSLEMFNLVLEDYIPELESKKFVWNNRDDFATSILTPLLMTPKNYFYFQGDDTTLALLGEALQIEFVLFNERQIVTLDEDKKQHIIVEMSSIKLGTGKHPYTMFLLYGYKGRSRHYQVLGHTNEATGKPQGLFYRDLFPRSFLYLYQLKTTKMVL